MANKNIKFDLPIKGKSISTFEGLRSNFGAELLPIFQSGRLHKWFLSRKLVEKADAVKAIDMQGSELEQLTGICKVLEVEGDDKALALIPVYFESKHNMGYAFYCNNPANASPIYVVNNGDIETLRPTLAIDNASAKNSTLDKYIRVFSQPDEIISEDGNTTNHIITAAVIDDFSIESAVKTGYFFTNINDAQLSIEHSKISSNVLITDMYNKINNTEFLTLQKNAEKEILLLKSELARLASEKSVIDFAVAKVEARAVIETQTKKIEALNAEIEMKQKDMQDKHKLYESELKARTEIHNARMAEVAASGASDANIDGLIKVAAGVGLGAGIIGIMKIFSKD